MTVSRVAGIILLLGGTLSIALVGIHEQARRAGGIDTRPMLVVGGVMAFGGISLITTRLSIKLGVCAAIAVIGVGSIIHSVLTVPMPGRLFNIFVAALLLIPLALTLHKTAQRVG